MGSTGATADGHQLEQPAAEELDLVQLLHALGDPVRLHLFRVLADGAEHGSAPSDFRLERLHKSTMSHHFRVLRQAGLTSTRTSGRNRYIRLRRDDLDTRFPGLVGALLRSLPES